jgi:hypothetical protein
MTLSLSDIPIGNKTYPSIVKANFDAIASAINDLEAQILAVSGDGAQLLLEIFDRNGIVGSTSYRLDLGTYAGGSAITIGRRPTFDAAKQEKNVSVAFGTYGGQKTRVTLTGDVVLDAASISAGLPTTIYVGIPSNGTPQLFPDNSNPEVLYAYSLCWDGYALTCPKYECPILEAKSTLDDVAGAPATERIFDNATDWLAHNESRSTIVLAGSGDTSETGLNLSRQVLGGFIAAGPADADGWSCPGGAGSLLTLELWDDQDRRWNFEDIVIDVQATPTRVFFTIDPVIGDDRWATDVVEFRLVKISMGGDILSARGFSWGLDTVPVIGTPIAKNDTLINVF